MNPEIQAGVSDRAVDLFGESQNAIHRRTDRLFANLMLVQWLAGIAAALWISPKTWIGATSQTHWHVWASIFLGGAITSLPVFLASRHPGRVSTRHVVAVAQMLTSALLIHLTGGRIETHFHVFGSLAFIACYRDWRVLLTATAVVSLEHMVRGIYWPQSAFGVLAASQWRWVEHAGWVVFEGTFLSIAIRQSLADMFEAAFRRAKLEAVKADIERQVAERTEQLTASHAELQSAVRDLENQKFALDQHAIVAVTDVQGRITYVNDRFCSISGYARAELLGQNHRLLSSGIHGLEFFTNLWTTVAKGGVWRGEICNRAKNGSVYWVDSTIVPLLDSQGKPHSYIAIRTDITASKAAGEALVAAKDVAESANRAKSEFLATMSHEIRTPMNGVLGFTELLLDSGLDEEQHSFAETIKESGESLLVIINDILDFSKIEAGKITLEAKPVDVAVIIQEVIGLLSLKARDKAIELGVDFRRDVPTRLVTDPSRVRQVFLNLVGNALKFTERGSVTIRVTEAVDTTGRFLKFEIVDTGIGIPKDKQGQLFQKFTQADSSTTRKFGGTGLGLAISKRLIELMGGQVGLESEPGLGSTFWFTLPLNGAAHRETPPGGGRPPSHQPSNAAALVASPAARRVLVVEDNAVNQRLVMTLLKRFDYEAELATNGNEAVRLFQSRPYDLVLMDCLMPEMDGFEAAATIRHIERLRPAGKPRIPIVAVTASVTMEEQDRCRQSGMDDVLTKPFQPEDLEKILARWTLPETAP